MIATRETLHQLIDNIDSRNIDLVCQLLIRFVEHVPPSLDEIEAIEDADKSIATFGTVSISDIDWS